MKKQVEVNILIEVNVAQEESKFGTTVEETATPVSYTHLDVYKRQGELFSGDDGTDQGGYYKSDFEIYADRYGSYGNRDTGKGQ